MRKSLIEMRFWRASKSTWFAIVLTLISFVFFLVGRELAKGPDFRVLPWDSRWYYSIAMQGYSFNGDYSVQAPIVFSPGLPMAIRAASYIFETTTPMLAIYVSVFFALITSVFFIKTLEPLVGEFYSKIGLILLLFNPFSIYLFNGYSESISAAVTAIFIWALYKRNNYLAALAISALSLCRPQGVVLLPFFAIYLFIQFFEKYKNNNLKDMDVVKGLVQIGMAACGFCFFIWWQYLAFGDPLLFLHIRDSAWAAIPPTFPIYAFHEKFIFSMTFIVRSLLEKKNHFTGVFQHSYFWLFIFFALSSFWLKNKTNKNVSIIFSLAFPLIIFSLLVDTPVAHELGRYSIAFIPIYMTSVMYLQERDFLMTENRRIKLRCLVSQFACVYISFGSMLIVFLSNLYFKKIWI